MERVGGGEPQWGGGRRGGGMGKVGGGMQAPQVRGGVAGLDTSDLAWYAVLYTV